MYFCFIAFDNQVLFGNSWDSHIPLFPDVHNISSMLFIHLKYVDFGEILLCL